MKFLYSFRLSRMPFALLYSANGYEDCTADDVTRHFYISLNGILLLWFYLGHLGSFHVGHTFAQLGKSIATKFCAHEMGAVLLVLVEIKCFVEPVHAALELF